MNKSGCAVVHKVVNHRNKSVWERIFCYSCSDFANIDHRNFYHFSIDRSVLVLQRSWSLIKKSLSSLFILKHTHKYVFQCDFGSNNNVQGWKRPVVRLAEARKILVHKFFWGVAQNAFDVDALHFRLQKIVRIGEVRK